MAPHIVILLVDDMPWQMHPHAGRSSGEQAVLMPHVASLVDDGLALTRHYTYPLCAPARASLLTGRWPHRAYHSTSRGDGDQVVLPMDACRGISPGMTSLAEKLKGAGYRTHLIGKWHLGHATLSHTPWARGFDSAYGFFASGVDHFLKCSYHVTTFLSRSAATWCRSVSRESSAWLYDWFEHVAGRPATDASYFSPTHPAYNTTYLTTLHVQRAVQLINEHEAERAPLFLYFAFANVHAPFQAPPELEARVDALRDPGYFSRCSWFDWGERRNPTPRNPSSPVITVPSDMPQSTCRVD